MLGNPGLLIKLARLGRRFAAMLLDGVIGLAAYLAAAFGAVAVHVATLPAEENTAHLVAPALVALLVPVAVYGSLWMQDRSPEKAALGLRVIRTSGEPVGFWRMALREIIGRIAFGWIAMGIGGLIDLLWPLRDKDRRAVHDKMADTLVVTAADAPFRWHAAMVSVASHCRCRSI